MDGFGAEPTCELLPISLSGFHSSASHWRNLRDESCFIKVLPDQPAYAETQVREIVGNILLFQRANGGWPKDYDMAAILTEEQTAAVRATHEETDTSFDNGNIHSQVSYLARAFAQAGEPTWKEACLRGLQFLFTAQYPNGGFPQRYPGAKDFRAHITFNDFVTIGILHALKDVADGAPHWQWLDDAQREPARVAVQRGVECIWRCQIRANGRLTGWCQQHDEKTFEPRPGRTFELASICPQDTTEITRFLMRLKKPTPAIMQSVEAAVAWLRQAQLTGVRIEKAAAPEEDFKGYTAAFDKALIADSTAPLLWARHYEIGTDRPIFAGRDGVKKYTFDEIERERRTGTPWFGTWPQKLIDEEYPRWNEQRWAEGSSHPIPSPN